jgi:hypothetical protein
MKKIAIAFVAGFLAMTASAFAEDRPHCNQSPTYGDCSRNNDYYRHGRYRSRHEPYYYKQQHYDFHQRAASRRQGYHERAESVSGR